MEGLNQAPLSVSTQGDTPGGGADAEAKLAQEAQMRRELMSTVLDVAARERLSRIALVSPERSKQIEGILVRMAQSGQLQGRITENQLIELLEQMEDAQRKVTTVKSAIVYQRRRDFDDDFDI